MNRNVPGHHAVVLLAAIVGEAACNRDPPEAVAINLHGALKVLDAARSAGVTRFVFTSTCSNYDATDTGQLVTYPVTYSTSAATRATSAKSTWHR